MEVQARKRDGCLLAPQDLWPEHGRAGVHLSGHHGKHLRVINERERAREVHDKITQQQQAPLVIYTDGSGYQGNIGAAAVVPAFETCTTC